MNIISVKNLSKEYGFYRKEAGLWGTLKSLGRRKKEYAHAVQNISFEVNEGEVVGFLGPNGAGKTTTLKMLSGILHPSSGTASVLGFTPYERKNEFKKRFGIVMGQKDQLARHLPAGESFLLIKELYGVADEETKKNQEELTEAPDIQDLLDVPVKILSLGQRMKCELAAALLHNPKVLFLDEPTIGLDVVAQKNIRDFIKKYNALKKTTILLTSHYMEDIKELCERVIIINFGQILYDGNLAKLIETYATEKVITVSTSEQIGREIFEQFGTIEKYEGVRASVRIPRAQVREVAAKLFASTLPIDDIAIEEMPIDDIIREIFQNKKHTQLA